MIGNLFATILVVLRFGNGSCIQFSFTPYENITILQSAVYKCTVSEVGHGDTVAISWNVNGTSSASSSWDSYISSVDIVADGIGTENTALTMPGDPILNGTIVTCIASGLVNGEGYVNTSSDTLYIQGKPDIVSLKCGRMSSSTDTSVQSNWTVPYTIHGVDITGYRVNITNSSGDLLTTEVVTDTRYTYSICEYSNISVAAVIGELEGEIDSHLVDRPEDQYYKMTLNVQESHNKINEVLYMYITMKNPNLCGSSELPTGIVLNTVCTADTHVQNYSSVDIISGDNITGIFTDIDKGHHNYTVTIEYKGEVSLESDTNLLINTYNIQDMTIGSENITGHVCFHFTYISGADKAFVEYTCSTESQTTYGLFVIGDSDCITITSSIDTCTVKAYDIESSNSIYPTPAVVITTVLGRVMTDIIVSSSVEFSITCTSSTKITSTRSSMYSAQPSIEPSNSNAAITNSIIITSLSGTTIIVLIVIILVCIIILCKNKKKVQDKKMNYVETSFTNSTGPIPSISTSNTLFPYSEVRADGDSENEYYARLNHIPPSVQTTKLAVQNGDSSLYSQLHLGQSPDCNQQENFSMLPGQISRTEHKKLAGSRLTYQYVVNSIVSRIPEKWEEFGRALALTPLKLQEIRENHPNSDRDAFCDVIQEWQTSRIRPFTMDTLHCALNTIIDSDILDNTKC